MMFRWLAISYYVFSLISFVNRFLTMNNIFEEDPKIDEKIDELKN